MTIQQIQAAINSKANDPRQLINMIADYLQENPGGSSGGLPYKAYSALVKQPNASAPVTAKSYQDDFTGLTWGRVGAGQYYAGAIGQFTIAKTVIPPFGDGGQINMPILDGGGTLIGYYTLNTADDGDYINLIVINALGVPTELSSLIGNNGTIFVEIRVYP